MAFLAACVLLMATFKNESLINYSAGWISYLGKISYGIYLFHIFAIVFACKLVSCFFDKEGSLLVTFFLCLSTLILSIVFGGISYHYYESYFLKLKQRFRQPSSGLSSKHKYKNEIVHEK
jgi:peptidoglycan/LPS O-acetylase OafA/YrhL